MSDRPSTGGKLYDVFLSYSWQDDKPFVGKLDDDLRKAGFAVFRDEEEMPSRGPALRTELRMAIDASDRFLPVIGPAAVHSAAVQLEWNHARATCKAITPILRLSGPEVMPEEWRNPDGPLYFDFRWCQPGDADYEAKLAQLIRRLHEPIVPIGPLYGALPLLPAGVIARREMEDLLQLLDPNKSVLAITGSATVGALHATGGLGKTVLAAQFVHNCAIRHVFFDGLIWVEVGKTPDIPSLQAGIGAVFGDSRLNYPDEERGQASLQYILRDKHALIVLDNCWEARDVRPFLVDVPDCRWLITTRKRALGNLLGLLQSNVIAVGYLTPEEGLALIAQRLGLDPASEYADKGLHRQIAEVLGGHTQAIAIAAARLDPKSERHVSAADLLRRFQEQQEGPSPFADLALEDDERVANLELSLSESYDDLLPEDRRRFRLLGLLAPDSSFDRSLAAALWGVPEDEAQDGLSFLVGQSLLDRTEGGRYVQHDLLRAYALALLQRGGGDEPAFGRYADWVIEFARAFDELLQEEWHTLEPDLPHVDWVGDALLARWRATSNDATWANRMVAFARNVARYVNKRRRAVSTASGTTLRGLDWLETGRAIAHQAGEQDAEALLLNEAGWAWFELGERAKALDYYQQALPLWRMVGDHANEAATLNALGRAWSALGERAKALGYYQQALSLWRAVGNHAGEAGTLNNLGRVWFALGEMDKALDYYQQALSLWRVVGNHAGEASILNNLGRLWSGLGEKTKALDYYQQSLSVKRVVGDRGGEATALNNLGRVWHVLGDQSKALDYYQQALSLWRAIGSRGGEATTLTNIGQVWSVFGDKTKALDCYQQALSFRRAVRSRSGEAAVLSNIGQIWSDLGEKTKALEYLQQALSLRRAVSDRAGEATTLHSMGSVWSDLGDQSQALDYLQQALSLRRTVGDRAGEAATLNAISRVWSALGDKAKALDCLQEALLIFRCMGGRDGEAITLNNLGRVWSDLGEQAKALEYLEQALPLFHDVGDRSGEAATLNNIGRVWDTLGEKAKALGYFERALPLRQAVGDRVGEAATLSNIGGVYYALGDLDQAIAYVERCVAIDEQVDDPKLEEYRRTLERLRRERDERDGAAGPKA
ncbi:MAG: tetratricopeptide repeat protein [Anaerolineales bacterium]